MEHKDVITFWFEETSPKQWFSKDKEFDEKVREKFLDLLQEVARGEKSHWRETPQGRLAEIIVLDQFSRNMFRGTPEAFAYDELALSLAQEAVASDDDRKLDGMRQYFMYMPYMHSESRTVHKEALWLFLRLPFTNWWGWINYEYRHKKIIDRFGRYPHRNAALGRTSTPEEVAFLKKNEGF